VLGNAYQGGTFTGAPEQFWLDALPASTHDSCAYQQEVRQYSMAAITAVLSDATIASCQELETDSTDIHLI